MLNRRALLGQIGLSVLMTGALAACGRGSGGNAGALRVGSQKGGTKSLMLASGALDGIAYTVEWSEFPAAQNLLEALGSGAIDTGLVGDAPFQFAYQAGSPIKAIGAQVADQHKAGAVAIAVVVPAASSIHDARGLKGRRIATTRGSIGHYLLLRALLSAGLGPGDVTVVFLSPSDARAALQAKAVDGWSTWQPYVAAAQADGNRIAIGNAGLAQGVGFDIVNEAAIKDKQPLLADFVQREAKALKWASAHPDAYAKVLAQETGLPLKIARQTATTSRLPVPIDQSLIDRQQVVLDTFRQFGEVKGARFLKDAFVMSG